MASFAEQRANKIGTTMWNLTAVEYLGGRRGYYKFACACGGEAVAPWGKVKCGDVKSCGCWRKGRPVSADPFVPHRAVYHRYRLSARHRDLVFDLTEQELYGIIVQPCSYCGLPPSTDVKLSAHPDFRYTGIDRVDNDKGYEKDNVVPCCETCNTSKRTMPLEQWKDWIARVYRKLHKE